MWIDDKKTEQNLKINIPNYFDGIDKKDKADILKLPALTKQDIKQVNAIFTPYIFYRRKASGKYTCFCTCCNTEFEINQNDEYYYSTGDEPPTIKHNHQMYCPHCKVTAELKCAGYSQKNLTERQNVIIYKVRKNIVYAICIIARKAYNGDIYHNTFLNSNYHNNSFERMPNIVADYKKLVVLRPQNVAQFQVLSLYAPDTNTCWKESYRKQSKVCSSPLPNYGGFGWSPITYADNYINTDSLNKSFLKYARYEIKENLQKLEAFAHYPMYELADKMGFFELCNDICYRNVKNVAIVDWNAKSPKHFFKYLNKAEVNEAMSAKARFEDIIKYQNFKFSGKRKSFNYIVSKRQNLGYIKNGWIISHYDDVLKYLKKQVDVVKWEDSMPALFVRYSDYLDIAEFCGYDLNSKNILFPRNILQAHDDALQNKAIIEQEREERKNREKIKAEKLLEKGYQKYRKSLQNKYKQFSFENLVLVVPRGAEDIVNEGKVLQHCVGGYAHRHITGVTTILFIRKSDDISTPYYTIEVRNNEIQQCYGFKDNQTEYYDNEQKKYISDPLNKKTEQILRFEKEFAKFLENPRKWKNEHNLKKAG